MKPPDAVHDVCPNTGSSSSLIDGTYLKKFFPDVDFMTETIN
jgi:hypothetical protein